MYETARAIPGMFLCISVRKSERGFTLINHLLISRVTLEQHGDGDGIIRLVSALLI